MALTFGTPVCVTGLDTIRPLARRQALECWRLHGSEYETVDAMLAAVDVRWFIVCDERGVPFADYWQLDDTGLLFRAGRTTVLGMASERGWAYGSDVTTWEMLASAHDAPRVVRAVEASRALERELAARGTCATWPCEDQAPDTVRDVA